MDPGPGCEGSEPPLAGPGAPGNPSTAVSRPGPEGAAPPLAEPDSGVDDEIAAAKATIRADMRRRRAGLGADALAAAGAAVSARLRALPEMRAAGLVAAYRAVRGEIPLEDLMSRSAGLIRSAGAGEIRNEPVNGTNGPTDSSPPGSDSALLGRHRATLDQVSYTLPRVKGRDLEFAVCWPGQRFEPGAFAIPEPVGGEVVPLADHDVVLVPVVAFDAAGYRIGQGRGFYDRALAALTAPRPGPSALAQSRPDLEGGSRPDLEGRSGPRPVLIGIAHSFQQIDEVPRHPWDVALDAVVTEAGLVEVALQL